MKQYIASTVAATGLIIFIFALDASAQISNRTVAEIPFDFYIGKELLPRGKYEFERASRNAYPSGLIVRSVTKPTARSMIVSTLPNDPVKRGEAPAITFNRYGSVHYLSGISSEPGSLAVRLRKTSGEKAIARQFDRHSPVVIRLASATGN
jgi:hypothetical protein